MPGWMHGTNIDIRPWSHLPWRALRNLPPKFWDWVELHQAGRRPR